MKDKILRFEITDRCNMKCDMCWSKDWKHNDLSDKKVAKTIYDFKKNGGKTIVLTSREPLLSKNFKLVVDICKKENLDLKILTNATLITDETAKYIIESNIVSFIAISIHGIYEEHDNITGVHGSLKKAIEGIQNLNKYKRINRTNIPEIRLTTVVSNEVINSIDFIISTAKENLTQLRIQHYMWHPASVKNKHKEYLKKIYGIDDYIIDGFPSECNIDYKNVISMLDYAKLKCKEEKIDLQIYPKMTDDEIEKWYGNNCEQVFQNGYCQHVIDSIRLRANGEISLCQYIDFIIGNIENKTIKDIVSNKLLNDIGENLKEGKIFPICNRCCHIETKELEDDKISNSKI